MSDDKFDAQLCYDTNSLNIMLSNQSDPPKEVEPVEPPKEVEPPKPKRLSWKERGYKDTRDRRGRVDGHSDPNRNKHGKPKVCICGKSYTQKGGLDKH